VARYTRDIVSKVALTAFLAGLASCDSPSLELAMDDEQPRQGAMIVSLVPSKPTFQVGEAVVVDVAIEDAHDVGSVPFHLRYDPSVLQFVPPAIEGPFLASDGADTVFLVANEEDDGQLVVGLSRLGAPEGASGSGTLVSFEFQAMAAGDCGFAFTGASVKDPQAENLPAAFQTAALKIE